jgi:hypothetical protein
LPNGWPIVATYEDAGISGAKGRDSRACVGTVHRIKKSMEWVRRSGV